MKTNHVFSKTVLLLLMFASGESLRILLFPINHRSHFMYFGQLGKALIKNGHEVTMVHGSGMKVSFLNDLGIKFVSYQLKNPPVCDDPQIALNIMKLYFEESPLALFLPDNPLRRFTTDISEETRMLYYDKDTVSYLKEQKYDFIITEMFGESLLLPYHLEVPYAAMSIDTTKLSFQRRPVFTSLESSVLYDRKTYISLKDRTLNFCTNWLIILLSELHFSYVDLSYTAALLPDIKKIPSYNELAMNTSLFFTLRLPVVNSAKSLMPNMLDLGTIMGRPANLTTLPPQLALVADNAKGGFAIVSFGSMFDEMGEDIIKRLIQGFNQFKMPVIIKLRRKVTIEVAPHITISPWLPQNDLLGHLNAAVFVTHCGYSGITEALYHGIPIVGFPIGIDQNSNCIQLDGYGGIVLSLSTFTPNDLVKALDDVSHPGSLYHRNMKEVSTIFKDLPDAGKAASYWIEHVLKHGAKHLRTPAYQLTAIQYHNLDVLCVLVVTVTIIVILQIKCCRYIGKCCCRKMCKRKTD